MTVSEDGPALKAGAASLSLYHVKERARPVVSDWHRDDHRPEVLGTLPGVYIAQRWEAPPEWVQRRGATALAHHGGEYAHLYWTSGSAKQLDADFARLGERLERAGRMRPMRYLTRTWPDGPVGLEPVSVHRRPDVVASPPAVPAMSRNCGLMIVIGRRGPGIDEADFGPWQEREWIPRLLLDSRLTGVARLQRPSSDLDQTAVLLCYLDSDPLGAFAELQDVAEGIDATVWSSVFAGVYRRP